MSRITIRLRLPAVLKEFTAFFKFLNRYLHNRGYIFFRRFELLKGLLVDLLYKKRGRYSRPFLHFGTLGLIFIVITFGPLVLKRTEDRPEAELAQGVLSADQAMAADFYTQQAEEVKQYRGGEEITHIVHEGETLSSIAVRYGLDPTTIQWENNLSEKATLKPGQELTILPVNGIRHKVSRGETIFSVAKKYGLDDSQAQVIVDYPFNEFLNDETFELATGQFLMVPGGVKPEEKAKVKTSVRPVTFTPDAGSANATGSFVWPAQGRLTQYYSFYHRAIDVANKGGGPILAADGGVVTVAGWIDNSGYGNRVMIDHGNGYVTLYAHLSVVQVRPGQRVNRGDVLGQMGNTGRSTGTHLHFEIRQGGIFHNPMSLLQ